MYLNKLLLDIKGKLLCLAIPNPDLIILDVKLLENIKFVILEKRLPKAFNLLLLAKALVRKEEPFTF